MMCSNILLTTDLSETGGSLPGCYMGLSCRVVLSEPLSSQKELLPCPVRFENGGEHWSDFTRYHDQKSSWYVVRSRGLVWFEIFKKFDDTGVEMMMGSVDGMLLWPISGTLLRFSLV